MKAALQLATSVLALGGLLFQATSHATSLSEQPLKISVHAKPNVLFAMDDSGSMDAEVMIDGNRQGWFYAAVGSNYVAVGTPRNGATGSDLDMFYLFPNGTNTGARTYADGTGSGYAIPPIKELAWLRSSDYNPIYYNPLKTYKPWAPAVVSGTAATAYSAANPAAAKSHPVLGTTTMALNANVMNSAANWLFTFTAGMTVPSGATTISCRSGSLAASRVVSTSNQYCRAAVSYYPATYWVKQACTYGPGIEDCAQAWDGSTIKRYEIKSGNTFPSGRNDIDEMKNFANWYQYYRKRRLLLAAAMGEVLENISGVRMGVVAFNAQATPTMQDADSSADSANARATAGTFYKANATGGTPTHGVFKYLYDQFNTNTNIVKYACQRNAAFIITDGFSNDSTVFIPSYSKAKYGGATPYQTTATGSLADQALAYFTATLRVGMALGKVPLGNQAVPNPDPNPDLHVNTYALTLGAKGTLFPARTDAFTAPHPTWPTPVSDTATMIDDLWHATVNGRGQMYMANDVDTAITGINAAMSDIISQVAAQSSVAVSTANLLAGDGKAYEASYNPSGWTGDLTARAVDNQANITTVEWGGKSAADILNARDWTTRRIFTSNGSSGLTFTTGNIGSVVNPDPANITNTEAVEYLRGNRAGEGTDFRTRKSLIGPVVNAKPAVDGDTKTVYLASGEGMLHAFDTNTGIEEWAFVPYAALTEIGKTIPRKYVYKTKLDSTPVVGPSGATGKLLVGGMGAAGRSYYALDVTNPKGLSEAAAAAQVKWTFPSPAQASYQTNMGYTVGRPLILKSAKHGYVTLVTSGYDNGETIGDGKGRVWVLDGNGNVLDEFVTTAGTAGTAEAGLSQLAAYREDDGTVRFVYGGDLLGNLWKFDLVGGTTTLLATLRDGSGNAQPVTTAPQLTQIDNTPVVIVGTGRLLDIADFGSTQVQTIYAITDGAPITNARTATTPLTREANGDIVGEVDWTTSRGWYLDLPMGEQVNVDPKYALGWLHVVSNMAKSSDCSASSYVYRIKVRGGKNATDPIGDTDVISTTANSTEPVLVQSGDNLYRWIRRDDGTVRKDDVTSHPVILGRKNAWREIAR